MSVLRRAPAAVAALLLAAALAAQSPPEAEEAAEFAHRVATAALRGSRRVLLEAIDVDGILRRLLGGTVWGGLAERQRGLLRAAVGDHFADALAPEPGVRAEIAWSAVEAGDARPISVLLGLRYGGASLKTRWLVRRTPRGWTVEDVILVDPGLSLAGEVGRLLGPDAVQRRDPASQARREALPRVASLAAIALLVLLFWRRVPRERRPILWMTAAVPALLFALDGALAVRRALSEPYALASAPPVPPWRRFEQRAREAQRDGETEEARAAWHRAVEAGAPAAAAAYQMGLAARARGDLEDARADFERALSERPPAPGAARELALMALAAGRADAARDLLLSYLRAAGPDPDSLSSLAVAESNLGNGEAAIRALEQARALVGESGKRAELAAQVYARAGDAMAAVEALRPLEAEGRLDRRAVRADPAYLPIATEEAWVAFLGETPLPRAATPTP